MLRWSVGLLVGVLRIFEVLFKFLFFHSGGTGDWVQELTGFQPLRWNLDRWYPVHVPGRMLRLMLSKECPAQKKPPERGGFICERIFHRADSRTRWRANQSFRAARRRAMLSDTAWYSSFT